MNQQFVKKFAPGNSSQGAALVVDWLELQTAPDSQSFERCVKYRLLYVTLSSSAEFGVSVRFLVFRVEDLIVVELNLVAGLLGGFGKVRNVVRCALYMLWFWVECVKFSLLYVPSLVRPSLAFLGGFWFLGLRICLLRS